MKYFYLIIGVIFIGCNSRTITVETPKANSVKSNRVVVEQKPVIVEEEVVVEEPKVTKSIKSDVPPKCAMWSDGCNICTRMNSTKASCTTYPACHNRLLSCLQWN
ncbi:hypothetical protein MNB_SV-12-1097 [hydrothermal vent metagenome]|uniref:Uncharacterized protein n=1 Tax=hydrothermal vent metagenome TaxID=652676 RepID=A0A1W1BBK8_9ZZZZ